MKIIVFHQPFPMGNYKLNEIVASHFSKEGHEVYLLQQLNGAEPDDNYINQIKELTNLFYKTPKQDLIVSLGDNRALTSTLQGGLPNGDLASELVDAILQQINTGYNDKTQSRSFVTTSYVEKSGGPNQPEDEEIFSMTITPGPAHAHI